MSPIGKFIVLDGGNGAGKSTVLKAIETYLRARGEQVVMTREPGGTRIGEKIREVILAPETGEMCDVTELMLFAAARAQHVQEKIRPALARGEIVVSDRFDSATVSFQHHARGLSLELIHQLNEMAVQGLKPDMTIILDLDPAIGLQRVHSRGEGLDRLEKEHMEFLEKARAGYLIQARARSERFVVIDATAPLDEVITQALEIVERTLRVSKRAPRY